MLHPGDWVLLNAADKSQRITLCKEPPPSQQQQPEAQAGRSPPAQPSPQAAQQGQQPEQAGQRKRAPPEDEPLATRKKRWVNRPIYCIPPPTSYSAPLESCYLPAALQAGCEEPHGEPCSSTSCQWS